MDDQILVSNYSKAKYGQAAYIGTYPIVKVNDNGTLRYRRGAVTDVVNIRNVTPYRS